ncbi:MAG: class I SAM-dependent methyltransferase [Candidatus Kariarchaeaceae archaeon]|jgi:ubiquinone/menaquinone biosynthesis C-methylase UbiE
MEYLDETYDWTDPDLIAITDDATYWYTNFGNFLFKHIILENNVKMLDLACGTGFPLFELAERFGPTCNAVGVDIWEEAIKRCKLKIKVLKIGNVQVEVANAEDLPFGNDQFDLIVSNLAINNFKSPENVFSECYRVTKPKGRIVITTNLNGQMNEFYQVYKETLNELNLQEHINSLQKTIDHPVSIESASTILENAGFNISRTFQDQFVMNFLNGSALLRHTFIKMGFLPGWVGFLTNEEKYTVFELLEEKLNSIAEEKGSFKLIFPTGYIEAEK